MNNINPESAVQPSSALRIDPAFALKLTGMLLSGIALLTVAQGAKADTFDQLIPASHQACLRSMNALINESKGSATSVEVTTPDANTRVAKIIVSDGLVQITCDASRKMKLTRILNDFESAPTEQIALNTAKHLNSQD